jgi:putative N6-adenine-specific DNA methylase
MKMQFVATCLFGLEKFLGEEIDSLGFNRIETIDGRVTFEADEDGVADANVNFRFCEHIFIKLGSFPARTYTELFDGVRALEWENFIGKEDAFPVKGHCIKSTLFSVPDCQSIIKKATADRLSSKYGINWLPEDSGIKYQIEFFIFKDVATLMIDTSGVPLHKRGYRPAAGAAPIRETLAAALVRSAHLREDLLLWDPFCGSGTIAIEAAMMMTCRAPGLYRDFAAEKFNFFSEKIWKNAREKAESNIKHQSEFEAFASDIDEAVLRYASENARRAGVDKNIKFFREDATKIKKPDRRGTIICNPPYGERMMTAASVKELYRAMGKSFSEFYPWQIYIITSCENFQELYGKRADKVRKLYNGMIPCNFYQFFKPKDKK